MTSYCASPEHLCDGGQGKKIEVDQDSGTGLTATCVDLTVAHCEDEADKRWTQLTDAEFGTCENSNGKNSDLCPEGILRWTSDSPDGVCEDLEEDDCDSDDEMWY